MPGDVVRRMIKGKDTQRGYCRDISVTACVQVVGTKQVIPNVKSEHLVPLEVCFLHHSVHLYRDIYSVHNLTYFSAGICGRYCSMLGFLGWWHKAGTLQASPVPARCRARVSVCYQWAGIEWSWWIWWKERSRFGISTPERLLSGTGPVWPFALSWVCQLDPVHQGHEGSKEQTKQSCSGRCRSVVFSASCHFETHCGLTLFYSLGCRWGSGDNISWRSLAVPCLFQGWSREW